MLNTIAIWSGTLGNIPANWSLCNGDGGTPNLVAKFIRGAPAATNPGTTGGADSHGHASMTVGGTHTHTLSSISHAHGTYASGAHNHGSGKGVAGGTGFWCMVFPAAGAHGHTTSSQSHSHTLASDGAHLHTINNADGRPPFYEVAYIQAGAGAAIVNGIIIIWPGTIANIPGGWELCDGGDGRPDLREKFARGVNTDVTDPGTLGGNTQHTHILNNCAAHSHSCTTDGLHTGHTFSLYSWLHTHSKLQCAPGVSTFYEQTSTTGGSHTHVHVSGQSTDTDHNHNPIGQGGIHTHTVQTTSSLPQYRDVAYIYCNGASIVPVDGVLIWTGLLANIPAGWELCDGGNGRPDYRERFIRGAANGVDPGGVGGSDTHTHVDDIGGSHNNHTQTSSGGHSHANTNTLGSHNHSYASRTASAVGPVATGIFITAAGGSHSHIVVSSGTHSNHTVGAVSAQHTHQPWSSDDGRPAYYEVAFIINVTPPTAYRDITTRFRLRAQGFTDIVTRFGLRVLGYKDAATRFRLNLGYYKDMATRFILEAQDYQDVAARFKLGVQAYQDITTRFKLWVQVYNDTVTRFRLIARAYKDTATRFRLTVQTYKDTTSRFRLTVQNYRDAATRFRLWVEAYRDTATRFILNVLNYQDIVARFKLTVQAYKDTATRFELIPHRYRDAAARFRLSMQAYQDVSTRFFLCQPTWEELKIQQAVAALRARIEDLELEPGAHFRI